MPPPNLFCRIANAHEAICYASGEAISVAWLMVFSRALHLQSNCKEKLGDVMFGRRWKHLTAKTHMVICCVLNKILYRSMFDSTVPPRPLYLTSVETFPVSTQITCWNTFLKPACPLRSFITLFQCPFNLQTLPLMYSSSLNTLPLKECSLFMRVSLRGSLVVLHNSSLVK